MNRKYLVELLMVSLFTFGMVIPIVTATSNYRGKYLIQEESIGVKTQCVIKEYDEEEWEYWISDELYPDTFWYNDGDKEGAKYQSQITELNKKEVDVWDLYALIEGYTGPTLPYIIDDKPETESLIINMTDDTGDLYELSANWDVLEIVYNEWVWTNDEFPVDPDNVDETMLVLKHPQDIRSIYNELNFIYWSEAYKHNEIHTDKRFFRLTAKDLIFLLFVNREFVAMGGSVEEYFHEFFEELEEAARAGHFVRYLENYFSSEPLLQQFLEWKSGIDGIPPAIENSMNDVDIDENNFKITIEYNKGDYLPFKETSHPGVWNIDETGYEWTFVEVAEHDFEIEISIDEETGLVSRVDFTGDDGKELILRKERLPVEIIQIVPRYTLPIILGIFAISFIGVIYIIKKKKSKK